MKKSTRSRLTEKQIAVFPGNTLFDKIARAVCRAGTLPGKELFEAWEVARRVRRKYRGGRVVDLACGHGLLAHIMLLLDDSSAEALAVDLDFNENTNRLLIAHPEVTVDTDELAALFLGLAPVSWVADSIRDPSL